jgi:hypothetical protein
MNDIPSLSTVRRSFDQCEITWLEDWREIFRVHDLFPDFHHGIPEQFNCVTRIMIFLILFMYLFYGMNIYVLILMGLFIALIILYLALYKKNLCFTPMKESYEQLQPPLERRTPISSCPRSPCFRQDPIILYDSKKPDQDVLISPSNWNPSLIDVQQSGTWCKPDIELGEATASLNQSLVGGANPKTKIAPVIPTPIWDESWMPNDFVVPFKINDQRRQELSQNGYLTWDREIPTCSPEVQKGILDTYSCVPSRPSPPSPPSPTRDPYWRPEIQQQPQPQQQQQMMREDYMPPIYDKANYGQPYSQSVATGEMMDTSFGYFPGNSQYNYPVNMPPDRCMASPEMVDYNKNLFSIPLQPGVYTRSQVNQPDASMSNLGISFTQPHLPYECRMDDRGNMLIDEYDPNQYPSEYMLRGRDQNARDNIPRNEIYDPRLTGYGTSYRSYLDPMTGRPKFYYDDVDAHTQYNFISKNKIDFTNFAPNTGPYPGLPPDNFRQMANQTFHNDQMKSRTELQYRLMAKNSHREWQRRAAPIQTQGFGRAGCGQSFASSYAGPRGSSNSSY